MPDPRPRRRFPRWVYDTGTEPDPRFTLANERTFLAWIRTGLALLAAGVAIAAFTRAAGRPPWQSEAAALLLIVLGVASGISAYVRWMRHERAMRRGDPLPGSGMMPIYAVVVVVVAVLGISLIL